MEGEEYLDADFGFEPEILGSIGDYVWFDANGDGVQDPSEAGIANVTVTLTGPNGTSTTVTDADGLYIFDDLDAGDYVVTVGEGPANTSLTTPGTDEVILSEGEDYVEADFGFNSSASSISGTVFDDLDGDGIQDEDEPGIAGVVVTLTDEEGNIVTTTTDNDGNYIFDDLTPGDYSVVVGDGPEGSNLTTTDEYLVTLEFGEDFDEGDFGFEPLPDPSLGSIGDFVWYDVNGDAVHCLLYTSDAADE